MILQNITTNTTIARNLSLKTSLLSKTLGLIGKHSITPIYFTTRWGIHTFGVRHPITIFVCSKQNQQFHVQKIKSPLNPNQIYLYNPQYNHIFELPYQEYPVKIGNIIQLINNCV